MVELTLISASCGGVTFIEGESDVSFQISRDDYLYNGSVEAKHGSHKGARQSFAGANENLET